MLLDILFSFIATFFTAMLFKVPKAGLLPTSILGSLGYVIFLIFPDSYSQMVNYFFATLFITMSSEVLSRIVKMPATIFTVPAIIPLVPGIGLYDTMMHLVENNNGALETGTSTLLAVLGMAMAMVLTSFFTKSINTFISYLTKRLNGSA